MKKSICDICGYEEEFTDKCGLVLKEVCNKCTEGVDIFQKPTITKPSITLGGNPSAKFTKKYCTASGSGLTISDIDGAFRNYNTENMALLEYKSMNQKPCLGGYSQWSIYGVLDRALKRDLGDKFLGVYDIWSDEYEMTKATVFKINGERANLNDVVDLMNLKPTQYEPINFSDYNEYKSVNEL